ncbi:MULTISPECIES: DUF4307 domain-containing protein [unclassified Streptomyces]|uniref:DUF4307 domain-containing protein n=1 Tax=unclassified Streptomyces TaxID=2593676 RepID=UPI0019059F4A|nr:DUF4307 domain-containing protein [Streptomyces sp. HSG2]
MSTARTSPPAGRYGRSSDARTDRTLKIVGGVLAVAFLALIGYFGHHYVGQNRVSAKVIGFETAEDAVRVRLEVRKDADADGYCTIRSQAEDGELVGQADFLFEGEETRFDRTVTVRTKARATTAELVGCHAR